MIASRPEASVRASLLFAIVIADIHFLVGLCDRARVRRQAIEGLHHPIPNGGDAGVQTVGGASRRGRERLR